MIAARLRRALWMVQQRWERRPLTLLYHRIAEEAFDPWGLCVSPRNFRDHLRILRQNEWRSCSASEIGSAIQLRRPGQVAITFDDGYVDNLREALPALEAQDTVATLFVIAGQPGSGREFWWEELERIVFVPPSLPAELHIEIRGCTFRSNGLGAASPSGEAPLQPEWRAWDEPTTPRHRLFKQLYDFLRPFHSESRQACLDQLRRWSGTEERPRESRRCLTWQELRQMIDSKRVFIGGHTVTHPQLSSLPEELEAREIRECKALLLENLGVDVPAFSYPFGSNTDYTKRTIELLQRNSFHCAFTNDGVGLRRTRDLYQIPRFYVMNWDGDEFARRLGLRS